MGYFTDPIDDLMLGWRYFQEQHPDWFDKDHSVGVDSSNQARREKENNMSKKIAAGDTLTVWDLTDDYLGAEIEVGPVRGITIRLKLNEIQDRALYSPIRGLWNPEKGFEAFHIHAPVTVITPPPVVQPDEPTELGQLIRIEGDKDFRGVVVDLISDTPILVHRGCRCAWEAVLFRAGDRRIIVSDPPRWPDETPEVPERIERGEWPDDDMHLREWGWIDSEGDSWTWGDRKYGGLGWGFNPSVTLKRPFVGPWTRGNRAGHHDARVEQDNA